jgi:hypothetical protein
MARPREMQLEMTSRNTVLGTWSEKRLSKLERYRK